MPQFGFFFDQSRCSGCNDCAVACKNWNGLPPGPLKYLKIYEYERGSFPDVRIHFQWVPCYHCEEPVCARSCACGAIYKEPEFGAVLIESEKCDGCRMCYEACPYGAPVFESDEIGAKPRKCTMCMDRLIIGEKPICVLSCPNRALDFGRLSTMLVKYGDCRNLEDLPDHQITKPAVVFRPHALKRQLVPYNAERALELLKRRDPLPPVFTSTLDVTDIPARTVGRDKLVLKHKSASDLMRYTRSDEG
jgi:anaerobic dimethyl sulfoxide reductase subunit B